MQSGRVENGLRDAGEFLLEKPVIEAGVVRDEETAIQLRENVRLRRSKQEKAGAAATMRSVMPVNAWISGGNGYARVDQRVPFAHPWTRATILGRLDPDDADFGDPVHSRAGAGGLEIDDGQCGGEEIHNFQKMVC